MLTETQTRAIVGSFFDMLSSTEQRFLRRYLSSIAMLASDSVGFGMQLRDALSSIFFAPYAFERLNQQITVTSATRDDDISIKVISKEVVGDRIIVRFHAGGDPLAIKIPSVGSVSSRDFFAQYSDASVVTSGDRAIEGTLSVDRWTASLIDAGDTLSFDPIKLDGISSIEHPVGSSTILGTASSTPSAKGMVKIGADFLHYSSVVASGDRWIFTLQETTNTALMIGDAFEIHNIDPALSVVGAGSRIRVGQRNDAIVVSVVSGTDTQSGRITQSEFFVGDLDLIAKINVGRDLTASGSTSASWLLTIGEQLVQTKIETTAVSRSLSVVMNGSVIASTPLDVSQDEIHLRYKRSRDILSVAIANRDTPAFSDVITTTVNPSGANYEFFIEDVGSATARLISIGEILHVSGSTVSGKTPSALSLSTTHPFRYIADKKIVDAQSINFAPIHETTSGVISEITPKIRVSLNNPIESVFSRWHVEKNGIRSELTGIVFQDEDAFFDPPSIPLAVGEVITLSTGRAVSFSNDEIGIIRSNQSLPSELWIPVCRIDERFLQTHFSPILGVGAGSVSSVGLERRMRGVWAALMQPPTINVLRGLASLLVGIPTTIDGGRVDRIETESDELGRIIRSTIYIEEQDGIVAYQLDQRFLSTPWRFVVGAIVPAMSPLHVGVEIYDYGIDKNWTDLFAEAEPIDRFRAWGILFDVENMGTHDELSEVFRLLRRVKPTGSKIIAAAATTRQGDEDLFSLDRSEQDVDGAVDAIECMEFDEGSLPAPTPWALGDQIRNDDGHILDAKDVDTHGILVGTGSLDDELRLDDSYRYPDTMSHVVNSVEGYTASTVIIVEV